LNRTLNEKFFKIQLKSEQIWEIVNKLVKKIWGKYLGKNRNENENIFWTIVLKNFKATFKFGFV